MHSWDWHFWRRWWRGYHAGPALSAEDVGTIQAAVENLRSADHDERRTEAAWRIASKLEEIARRALGQTAQTK